MEKKVEKKVHISVAFVFFDIKGHSNHAPMTF